MSIPSSVKFSKNGVEYLSNVDRTKYTIKELSRAALRDVGKYITRTARKKTTERKRFGGGAARKRLYGGKNSAFGYWVRKIETDLQVGIKHNTWYGVLQELGDKNHPRRSILLNSTQENIDEIRKIEGQYLSAVEDENRALGLISEEEYEDDGTE